MNEEINYYDYEDLIKAFWKANIKQDYSNFDFIQACESLENPFYSKLAQHGFLGLDEFIDDEEQMGIYDYDCLTNIEQKTDYIQITKEELKKVIQEYKYKRNREEFLDMESIKDLKLIYDEIQKAKSGELTRKEMVFLIDKIIHAEHETGFVLDLDITTLKRDFEEELKGGLNK